MVKKPPASAGNVKRRGLDPWVGKIPWRRKLQPTPVLLPGKSHGRRSLVGCRPWGLEESDTTEQLPFHFSLSRIGEGDGNPLQCSCLENPRDGRAWRAAIYGGAQSQTQLKWLSSSSSIYFKKKVELETGVCWVSSFFLCKKDKNQFTNDYIRRWVNEYTDISFK